MLRHVYAAAIARSEAGAAPASSDGVDEAVGGGGHVSADFVTGFVQRNRRDRIA
jgi:hypothetical protein